MVVDASVIVSALVDPGRDGRWAETEIARGALAGPELALPLCAVRPTRMGARSNLTCYDAWYVALAETLACPLVTLDKRLSRAPGPRCRFTTPL